MKVTTETGSVYLVDNEALTVARVTHTHDLRRDGEAVAMLIPVQVVVGQSMTLVLEPLSPKADVTMRYTSPVVSIEAS